jgi:hypothetical protein
MISRHDTRRPPAAGHVADPVPAAGPVPTAGPVPAAGPAPERCERGGLDAVINGSDLITATTHFGRCIACQREFLSLGALPTSARPAAQSQAASVKPAKAAEAAEPKEPTEAAEPTMRIS